MTNRKYEKIKEYTKVAREEIMNSLGYDEKIADRILMLAILDITGKELSSGAIEWLFDKLNTPDKYVFVMAIAEELSRFMEGGSLPEGA